MVDELREEEIKHILQALEDAYRNGEISEEAYERAKKANLEKLNKLRKGEEEEKKEKKEKNVGIDNSNVKNVIDETISSLLSKFKEENDKKIEKVINDFKTKFTAEKEKFMGTLESEKSKIIAEMEKLKSSFDVIKSTGIARDERLQRIAEEVGEIRAKIMDWERNLKEEGTRLEIVEEAIKEIKPERFIKKIESIEKTMEKYKLKIERLESLISEAIKGIARIQKILNNIGNVENLVDISKRISKIITDMEDRESKIKRLAGKIEKAYVEINNRLNEFVMYKEKQKKVEELAKEMLKAFDDMRLKMESFIRREEIDMIRESLEKKIIEILESRSVQHSIAVSNVPKTESKIKESEMEKDIVEFLHSLEEMYKSGDISKEEYNKLKELNLKKLEKIRKTKDVKTSVEKKEEKKVRKKTALEELKDMLKQGLISKEAYEEAKKILEES